ncbi:MAG: phosphotransferase family protein [Thermoleophilaceae bacterium]
MTEKAEALTAGLRSTGELGAGEQITAVEQLSGGWSRHSYTARADDRAYIVRVKPEGGLLETDLEAEYAIYDALQATGVAIPRVFLLDASGDNPFGGPYFVMESVPGRAPNTFRRPDREWLEQNWRESRTIATDMVDNLARLHLVEPEGLTGRIPRFDFLEVVARWREVYESKHLTRDPVTEEAFEWLVTRVPPDVRTGLVHGDYRVGNALVEGGRVTAVLDWELAYVGDVRFDLGYLALDRLAGKHLRPVTGLLNAFAERDWFFAEYERRTGQPLDPEVVRTFSVLGIMMLLATHYLGIWMHTHGRTEDFRMAWNRFGIPGLRQDLAHLMGW